MFVWFLARTNFQCCPNFVETKNGAHFKWSQHPWTHSTGEKLQLFSNLNAQIMSKSFQSFTLWLPYRKIIYNFGWNAREVAVSTINTYKRGRGITIENTKFVFLFERSSKIFSVLKFNEKVPGWVFTKLLKTFLKFSEL